MGEAAQLNAGGHSGVPNGGGKGNFCCGLYLYQQDESSTVGYVYCMYMLNMYIIFFFFKNLYVLTYHIHIFFIAIFVRNSLLVM